MNNNGIRFTFTPEYSINFPSILRFINSTSIDDMLIVEDLVNDILLSTILPPPQQSENIKKKITKEQFNRLERGYSTKECSICLEPNEESVRLPCGHFFHEDCISVWLLERCSECPLCKYDCSKI